MLVKGLPSFRLFSRVEGGTQSVGEGDGVETVSDTHGLFKVSWFSKFLFDMNFFFEAPDISVDHFFLADVGNFEDGTGEGGIVGLDRASLAEASEGVTCHFGGVDRFELLTEESFELLPVGQLVLIVGHFLEMVAPPGGCVSSKEVCCQVYRLFVIFDAGRQEVLLHLENPEVDRAFAAIVGFGLLDSDVRRGSRGSAAGSAISTL